MKVRWTRHALSQLTAIYEYIASDSPTYALGMVDRITARSKQLVEFPASGWQVVEYQHPEIREFVESPYRVIYRTRPDEVVVLSVIHGARELPPQPPLDG